jgi:hypothetical protein
MISAGRRSSAAIGTLSSAATDDEGRIGAVLQQTPHEIGQKVAVAADRRIGAAGQARRVLHQALIERVAHAVQTLEFVARRCRRARSRMVATVRALWVANCA